MTKLTKNEWIGIAFEVCFFSTFMLFALTLLYITFVDYPEWKFSGIFIMIGLSMIGISIFGTLYKADKKREGKK